MNINSFIKITKQSQKKFSKKEDHHDFLMFEIQKHLVEINDLTAKKEAHAKKEMADLAVLSFMLAFSDGVGERIFRERLKKFNIKIKQGA